MKNTCDHAKDILKSLDLREWQGLPVDCDWTPWVGPLPTDWAAEPRRPLGSSFRNAQMMPFSLDGYMQPMMSFVEGKAVMIDARGPALVDLEALKASLGKPAAQLDWDFGTLPIPGGEWVYPERGIALLLNTDRDRALHIALFAPTTLAAYEKDMRLHLKKTLRPE